jgi:hypothetical protein
MSSSIRYAAVKNYLGQETSKVLIETTESLNHPRFHARLQVSVASYT